MARRPVPRIPYLAWLFLLLLPGCFVVTCSIP